MVGHMVLTRQIFEKIVMNKKTLLKVERTRYEARIFDLQRLYGDEVTNCSIVKSPQWA